MTRSVAHGLRPNEDETPTSYCSRVAVLNGRSAREFCLDIGTDIMAIAAGDDDALSTARVACKLDSDAFKHTATTAAAGKIFTLGGQEISATNLTRVPLRVCPQCLIDDLTKGLGPAESRCYGRATWQVLPIGVCFHHGLELQIVSSGKPRVHDFVENVRSILPTLAATAPSERRSPTAYETYLRSRLRGDASSGETWLDRLPFYAAVKACEMVGSAAMNGRSLGSRNARSDNAGFEILSDGPDGIRDTLAKLAADFQDGRADWGPKSIFGRLYAWLAHESHAPFYEPLREVIRMFSIETMPMGPGDRIFGKAIRARRIHSIRSASLASGIHSKRLRKLLELEGLIDASSHSLSEDRVLFSASAAGPFLDRMASSMSLAGVGRYLNAPRPHERLLFEAGFVTPITYGGTHLLKDHAFAKVDLDNFLFDLLGSTTSMAPGVDDMHAINVVARHVGRSTMDIVRLVIDGRLIKLGRNDETNGYASVLVNLPEVASALANTDGCPDYETDFVEISALAHELKVPVPTVWKLHGADLLDIETRSHPIIGRPVLGISISKLREFREAYIFLMDLCGPAQDPALLFGELEDACVSPVHASRPIPHSLYRRRDLPPHMQAFNN